MTQRQDIHNSEIPVLCRSCDARHKGICGALDAEQLVRLSKHTSKSRHAPDTELRALSEVQGAYANILGGVVKLTKLMADGRQQIVGLQFAPDFMGRPFSDENAVSMEAATEVRLCSFPKRVLEDMLRESPQMAQRLHRQSLAELNEARDWLLTLGRKTAAEKVASFILLIVRHIDPEREDDGRPVEIEFPLKRADIADFLGLTTETVSRQLTHLRKRGLILISDRRTITIPDVETLAQAAEQEC